MGGSGAAYLRVWGHNSDPRYALRIFSLSISEMEAKSSTKEYYREYYRRRCEEDPEYRAKCNHTKTSRLARMKEEEPEKYQEYLEKSKERSRRYRERKKKLRSVTV